MKLSFVIRAVVAGAAVVCVADWASAFQKPIREGPPDFDRRFEAAAGRVLPMEKAAARASFLRRLPSARVDFDPVVASPRFISAHDRLLTGPSVKAATGGTGVPDIGWLVGTFLNEHRALFGHGAEVLQKARVARDYTTPHNGLRTVVWEQQLDGLAIFEGVLITHVAPNGALAGLSSLFMADAERAADRGVPSRKVLQRSPAVSAPEALSIGASNVGDKVPADTVLVLDGPRANADLRQTLRAPGLHGKAEARLVWLPLNAEAFRLCWQVIFTSQADHKMFRLLVDAETGEVWLRRCLTKHLSDATYRVYTSDSPSPFSPGHAWPASAQPPLVDRLAVTLSALDTNASPRGWIHDGINETCGNNVDAHLDRDGDGEPDLPRPAGAPFRVFDFPLDLAKSPSSYGSASAVQLFYWCNWMHDRLYQLGFTEAAGNFQKDNFGRGGLGGDALQAAAQHAGDYDNAMISVPPEGMPPHLDMFLFVGPDPDRDSALDGEVVLHEYAHGLTDRLVGGGLGLSAWQSAGLAEGWSDFYSLALLSEAGDDLDGAYAQGGYLSYLIDGLTENYYFGIRRYPCSTDLAKNPLTFKDIDPAQASPHSGVPLSPRFRPFSRFDAGEIHCQGEVWCATLWEVRANLVRKHGFEAGSQLTLQLVTDGLRLAPPNPDFVQARDAILLADVVNNAAMNLGELWRAFARRGLGLGAASPGSWSPYDVTESFDAPGQLIVFPTDGVTVRGPVAGPFSPGTETCQIANAGAGELQWAAGQGAGWLEIVPSSGAVSAGEPAADVKVSLSACASLLPPGCYTNTVGFTNLATGDVQCRDWVLRVAQRDFLTEWFRVSDFDLAFTSMTFTPDPSGDSYSVCLEPAAALPTDPLGGTRAWVGDDGYMQIRLSGTNQVALFGQRSHSFFVCGNGILTLGAGDSSYIETLEGHFSSPRISALFNDFDTEEGGGNVGVRELTDRIAVTYLEVSEYARYNTSTFQVEWFFDGRIRLTYLQMEARSGIVGLSRGEGFPEGFQASDFSAAAMCAPKLLLSLPPEAPEGAGLLAGAGVLSVTEPVPMDIRVQLISSDPAVLTIPGSVTISAGTVVANFDIVVIDDTFLNGPRRPSITATASGYSPACASLLLTDNETNSVRLDLPAVLQEGGPSAACSLNLGSPAHAPILVYLSSSDPARLPVPPMAIIPAGQTNLVFALGATDDLTINATQAVILTAEVPGWASATASVSVTDRSPPALALALPEQAHEGQGAWVRAGSVRLSGRLDTNLLVQLDSLDTSELAVPPNLLIPAGTLQATFDLALIDDAIADGPQAVGIIARADGFMSVTNQLAVLDAASPLGADAPEPVHLGSNIPVTTALSWKAARFASVVNGGFERGDFSGWAISNTGPAEFHIDGGELDPPGPDAPLPPALGGACALLIAGSDSIAVLSQDVVLPGNCLSASLSWSQCVRQGAYDYGYGDYCIEVRNTNDVLLKTAFYGDLGNFWDSGWRRWSCDLSQFASERVLRVAFRLRTTRGLMSLRLDEVTVTAAMDEASSWNVFVGKQPGLGPADLVGATGETSLQPPPLEPLTTYYWQVVGAGAGLTPGPVWQFTTRGPEHFQWQVVSSPQYLAQPFGVAVQALDELGRVVTDFHGAVALSAQAGQETLLFAESFELPVLTGWNCSDTNYHYATTTETASHGARCLLVTGGCGYPCTGISRSFSSLRPDRVRFHVRAAEDHLEGGHFHFTEGEKSGLYFYMGEDGTMGLYELRNSRIYWYNVPYEAGRWYAITFRCDWQAKTVDFYVDDMLVEERIPVLSDIESLARLSLYNAQSTRTWWDAIELTTGPEPVSLLMEPHHAGPFTNGVWSGAVSVSEPARNVRLVAADAFGYEGASAAFDVVSCGDVGLELSAASPVVVLGEELAFTFQVTNSGPGSATALVVSSAFPVHAEVRRLSASQGTWGVEGQTARFDLGTLAGGATATGTVVVLANAAVGITNTATVTRSDPDSWPANNAVAVSVPVLPRLSVGDLTVQEGNAGVREAFFPATLNAPADREISVFCSVAGGTALAGLDFLVTPGRLAFPPGTVSNGFQVQICGDTDSEHDEFFDLRLVAGTNAALARTQARCTILDDDGIAGLVHSFAFSPVPSPQEVGQGFAATLTAFDGFRNVAVKFNGSAALRCGPRTTRTVIDSGTTQMGLPLGTEARAHRSQVLYSGLGAAGRITSLSLNLTQVPGQTLAIWTVRLKHTLLGEFPADPAWDGQDWTVVCRTNWTITQTGWITCPFTTPFDYNGKDNLIVDFSFQNASSASGGLCIGTVVDGRRTLTASTSGDSGSPLAWTGADPRPDIRHLVPNLRLRIDSLAPATVEPAAAGPFVRGVWNGPVAVLEPGTNMVLWAEDDSGHRGVSAAFAVTAANDLALILETWPETARAGDVVTYVLSVTNTGPASSSQVVVTNVLPAHFSFLSATASQGGFTAEGGEVRFSAGVIPPGGTASFTVEASAATDGPATNRAMVGRVEPEGYLGNNHAQFVLQVETPCVFVEDQQIPEGNDGPTELPVRIWLSGASLAPMRVRFDVWGMEADVMEDFIAPRGDLVFAPGQTETNIVLRLLGDRVYEGDEGVRVYAWTLAGEYRGNEATILVLNDDPPPRLRVYDIAVPEGDAGATTAQFVVELSAPSGLPVSVDYCTADGSALAGRDYVPAAGTVELWPGELSRVFSVVVLGDRLLEPDERFFLRLSNATNALLENPASQGTILNDDGVPQDLAWFDWTPVASPQFAGQPFAVRLTARNLAGELAGSFTGMVALTGVVAQAWTTTLGANEQWQFLPLGNSYHEVRAQVIYPVREIGPAGRVLSLALNVVAAPSCVLSNFTIRLKHTPLSAYTGTPFWEAGNWEVVFREDLALAETGWTRFPLATAFEYDGTNNLLVDFSYNEASGFPYGYCLATLQQSPCVAWLATDEEQGDPLTWSGTMPSAGSTALRPDLRLEMARQTLVPIEPVTTESFISGEWTGDVAVGEPAVDLVLVAEDPLGHTGVSLPMTVEPALDSDADGLPDAWELRYFGSLSAPDGSPMADPDNDGADNLREFIAGTDPLDAASRFCILAVRKFGDTVRVTVPTVSGKRYQVQVGDALAPAGWVPVGEPLLGNGAILEIDADDAASQPLRFYRVALLP